MTTDTPAPAPDSHEPAGRVDVPGAAPEWAVEMAQKLSVDFSQEVVNLCNRSGSLTVGSGGVWEKMLARLLATLRERTLREAAGVCLKIREAYIDTADKYIGGTHTVFGSKGAALGEGADAILSLIAQPPKPERSDGSEAEGREEA